METKQRIYAVNYICDVSYRVLYSEFFLLKHTIKPHIEATERIASGDIDLLTKTFLTNEFDILKSSSPNFSHLPNEFALQIGYDDITLVQLFETLLYLNQSEINRIDLNEFVKVNLKSMEKFTSEPKEKQKDILFTYHDYLTSLEHESNRIVLFILQNVCLLMRDYIISYRFWLYSTKSAKNTIKQILALGKANSDLIPESDYMQQVKNGGIQGEL